MRCSRSSKCAPSAVMRLRRWPAISSQCGGDLALLNIQFFPAEMASFVQVSMMGCSRLSNSLMSSCVSSSSFCICCSTACATAVVTCSWRRASRCCSCCWRLHWLCWMSSSIDGVPWAGVRDAVGASGGCGRGGMAEVGSSSGACCLQISCCCSSASLHL